MADFKPSFEVSDTQVFLKLHKMSLEQAEKKVKSGYKQFLNTAISKDNKTFGGSKTGEYEIGVIYEIKGYEDTNKKALTGDDATKQAEKNKTLIDDYRKNAFEVIQEYMRWFCDDEALSREIKENSVTKFYPPQRQNADVDDYKIEEIEYEEAVEEMKNVPLIGFRIKYVIDYNEEDVKDQESK